MKKFVSILIFVICTSGCASIKEMSKGVAGVSTKKLEESRKGAILKTFDYDYFTCFTNTSDALKKLGCYIYAQDIKKHRIAIYVSEQDTTPVGIFFKEMSAASTQVEVSSPSTFAKELISGKLFQALKEKSQGEKGEIK